MAWAIDWTLSRAFAASFVHGSAFTFIHLEGTSTVLPFLFVQTCRASHYLHFTVLAACGQELQINPF